MDIKYLFDDDFLEEVKKEVTYEFQMFIKTAGEQFSAHSDTKEAKPEPQFLFTKKFHEKAEEYRLSEADALDVYYTGQKKSDDTLVREYNGYEIGIEYKIDPDSGKPTFQSIWKKDVLV